jgi:hypothetical protein
MFGATQAGRSLGLDNLIAKRLVPVFGDDGALGGASPGIVIRARSTSSAATVTAAHIHPKLL